MKIALQSPNSSSNSTLTKTDYLIINFPTFLLRNLNPKKIFSHPAGHTL